MKYSEEEQIFVAMRNKLLEGLVLNITTVRYPIEVQYMFEICKNDKYFLSLMCSTILGTFASGAFVDETLKNTGFFTLYASIYAMYGIAGIYRNVRECIYAISNSFEFNLAENVEENNVAALHCRHA